MLRKRRRALSQKCRLQVPCEKTICLSDIGLVQKQKLEPTRENYLAIDRCESNPTLTAEEEAMLPPQFRRPGPDDTGRVSQLESGKLAAMPLRV